MIRNPFRGLWRAMRTPASEILGAEEVPLEGVGEDVVLGRGRRGDLAGVRSHLEAGAEAGQGRRTERLKIFHSIKLEG